jgi:hypothetical protein
MTTAAPSFTDEMQTHCLPLTDAQRDGLRATLRYILEHPAEWKQSEWGCRTECGTAFCFAGTYLVRVQELEPVWTQAWYFTGWELDSVIVDGRPSQISVTARDMLGLGQRGNTLFSASNSLRRLVDLVYLYSGGRVDEYDRYWALSPDLIDTDRQREWGLGQGIAVQAESARESSLVYSTSNPRDWLWL